jgi:hypothetical protein
MVTNPAAPVKQFYPTAPLFSAAGFCGIMIATNLSPDGDEHMSHDILHILAEQKIREALENGEFDDLPGKGRPLPPDDLALVPPARRAAYKILRNAGQLPVEMDLKKEIAALEQTVRDCAPGEERDRLSRKLTERTTLFNILMEKRRRK